MMLINRPIQFLEGILLIVPVTVPVRLGQKCPPQGDAEGGTALRDGLTAAGGGVAVAVAG